MTTLTTIQHTLDACAAELHHVAAHLRVRNERVRTCPVDAATCDLISADASDGDRRRPFDRWLADHTLYVGYGVGPSGRNVIIVELGHGGPTVELVRNARGDRLVASYDDQTLVDTHEDYTYVLDRLARRRPKNF